MLKNLDEKLTDTVFYNRVSVCFLRLFLVSSVDYSTYIIRRTMRGKNKTANINLCG